VNKFAFIKNLIGAITKHVKMKTLIIMNFDYENVKILDFNVFIEYKKYQTKFQSY